MQWFERQAFLLMKWPSNSPDMNPIEHIWRVLKAKLHAKYPDTRVLRGNPEKVREVLEERLKKVWLEIGPDVLEGLILSMPSRVKALYKAKGWYTKY